jgi:hypothetical protein
MQKSLFGIILIIVISGASFESVHGASWVQSQNQGYFIRHPQGWQVDWSDTGVIVVDPQNPMVWCEVRKYSASGTSQQFTHFKLNDLNSRFQGFNVLMQAQVFRNPDIFGVKFSYQSSGVSIGSVMLTVTGDGREFVTHCYAAPAQVYDRAKLTLIPILASLGFQGGGPPGKASGNVQMLRAPSGSWSYRTPPGWRVRPVGHPNNETIYAPIDGPSGEFVEVQSQCGNTINFQLQKQKYGPQPPLQSIRIPYLSAVDLFRHIVEPFLQMASPGIDRQVTGLNPVDMATVQYSVTVSSSGQHFAEEGLLRNSSMPCTGSQDDLNLFSLSRVAAPAEAFPKARDQLWQIVSSFEAVQQFGTLALPEVLQYCAKMRRENIQALSSMAMRNIQTNQNMMRDTVRTTIQGMEQRRQEGDAWLRVFSGTEIAVDPSTGKRYEVPVGGQYIYANPTSGKVTRSDGPISPNDLPTGFRQLESVGLY